LTDTNTYRAQADVCESVTTLRRLVHELADCADVLERERDALNAVPRWRPIESAPKDGTPILVYSDGATNAVIWHGKDLGWQPVEPPYGEWWTPLPEPPTND
jgi:hypothetical protein